MRLLFLLLFAVAVPILLARSAHAGERVLPSGDRLHWDDGLEAAVERVAIMVPAVRLEVEDRLGFPFSGGPAEIHLVQGVESMRRAASAAVPDWAAGVCVGSQSRIVLRVDVLTPESPLKSIQTTLRHEWVHLAWARRAGAHARRLPLWMEEGLAEEIGGGVTVDAGRSLDIAAAFGHLIPFEEIRDVWPRAADRAGLAYRQGRSFVRYLVRERGWPDLHAVLERLADGGGLSAGPGEGRPFEVLVFEHTERPLDQWIAGWRTELEDDARPWFQLFGRDLGWTLLVAAALLSVVAFFVVRARRRRAIDALPDL